jgi:putative transport protein
MEYVKRCSTAAADGAVPTIASAISYTNIKGFSLGVGAVLFVALAVGWFAPKSVPAAMVGTLGLALFLYTVGVQYGKQFFLGLTSAAGRRANMMALIGVLLAGAVSIVFVKAMGLNVGHALGLFADLELSTPTLQAAIATPGNDDPRWAARSPTRSALPVRSCLLRRVRLILKPKIEMAGGGSRAAREIALQDRTTAGRSAR